ncbi:MAG: carbon storage regulator [Planctomycetota bacterium]
MLVLSRKVNEEIVIPDLAIILKVLHINGGRVKLAIDAPRSVSVVRSELLNDEASGEDTFNLTIAAVEL